jgi:hypothetical protein
MANPGPYSCRPFIPESLPSATAAGSSRGLAKRYEYRALVAGKQVKIGTDPAPISSVARMEQRRSLFAGVHLPGVIARRWVKPSKSIITSRISATFFNSCATVSGTEYAIRALANRKALLVKLGRLF